MEKSGLSKIAMIKLFGTVVLAISLPFSESVKTASLMIILLIFLVQWTIQGLKIKISMIHWGFILLFLSALASSIFAPEPYKSLKGAKDVLFYTAPFFVASSISSDKDVRLILWGLYLSTTLAALYGIFQFVETYRPLEIHSLGNQNYTAMYFLIITTSLFSTIVFSDREDRFPKVVLAVFLSIILVASVMTAMRASFLGFLAFLAILIFSRERARFTLMVSMGFASLIAVATFINKTMLEKLLTTQSFISRLYIWDQAIKDFVKSPIVGIGLNHFSYTFPLNNPLEPGHTLYDAHSLYFQVASQMGIIGVIALLLIVTGFILLWRNYKPDCGLGRALRYGAMGAFLIITVAGLFDTTLHHEHAIAFSMITGLMVGFRNRTNTS